MSGLHRSTRPFVAALLTLALVLGTNGFVGAIHSVHHLSTPVETHSPGAHGHGGQEPTPAGAPDETCPVAAAALHLAVTAVAALPVQGPSPVEPGLVTPGQQRAPRAVWREAASGRAPPSLHSLTG